MELKSAAVIANGTGACKSQAFLNKGSEEERLVVRLGGKTKREVLTLCPYALQGLAVAHTGLRQPQTSECMCY